MASRGRPRKEKPDLPRRPQGRPQHTQTEQMLAMAENQCIRFRFATDRDTYNAYHKLRSAVKRHCRDDITVHRDGHTIVVFT